MNTEQMLKGLGVGIVVIVASIPIPFVHFVTLPLGPFLAGYLGGNAAKVREAGIIYYGLALAGLTIVPTVALVLVAVFVDGGVLGFSTSFVIGVAIALVPYVWFASTVGALLSYASRQKAETTQKTS